MAECHIIGQITGASDFPKETLFCKWQIHFGNCWKLISGFKEGQTQIDSPEFQNQTIWCHPIDIHFATKGIQGWPKIHMQIYHHDEFGRNELFGYGFIYIPVVPGLHDLTCFTWRPIGSLRDEINRFFLGGSPQLKNIELQFTINAAIKEGKSNLSLENNKCNNNDLQLPFINPVKRAVNETSSSRSSGNLGIKKSDQIVFNNTNCNMETIELADNSYDILKDQVNFSKTISLNKELESHPVKLPTNMSFSTDNGKMNIKLISNIPVEAGENSTEFEVYSLWRSNNGGNSTYFVNKKETASEISPLKLSTVSTKWNNINDLFLSDVRNTLQENAYDRHHNDICTCDLQVNECDINCCCDEDCNAVMKHIFTTCKENSMYLIGADGCYESELIYKSNAQFKMTGIGDGLFCKVKDNLNYHLSHNEQQVIKNLLSLKQNMLYGKIFSFSPMQYNELKIQDTPYQISDIIWSVKNKNLMPFGILKSTVNMHCESTTNVRYLSDYSIKCLHSVPRNRKECESAVKLEMHYFVEDLKIIKSPNLMKSFNSSYTDKMCSSKTCVDVASYICFEISPLDVSACVNATPKRLVWDNNTCKNIVESVDYYIYHNGTEGIKEVRAYFFLKNITNVSNSRYMQRIKLTFLWAKTPVQIFTRSGNPGYLIGKPIMSGKIIYMNESATPEKEAIEISYNPTHWLSVFASDGGLCVSEVRKPILFGENTHHSCFVALDKYDFLRRKCVDLQESIFKYLIGDDWIDIQLNNKYNKFVATFANSKVEDTEDWVQVIVDTFPIVSSQISFFKNFNYFLCKNIFTELFIDVAFSKIGPFEKPQAKVLGVHFYFGSPKELLYYINLNSTKGKSNQFLKISTYLQFIDMTKNTVEEFAEAPGFEAKLPHDFFYPFFSKGHAGYANHLILLVTCFHYSLLYDLMGLFFFFLSGGKA